MLAIVEETHDVVVLLMTTTMTKTLVVLFRYTSIKCQVVNVPKHLRA